MTRSCWHSSSCCGARILMACGVLFLSGLLTCPAAWAQAKKPRVYKSITWEKFQASGPELKPIGNLAVRHAKEIKSSPWSIGCETLDRD